MRVVVIDNYDSFTYNLVQGLGEFSPMVQVFKNDEISVDALAVLSPTHLVISPGPGLPEQAGISMAVIEHFGSKIPILGVCLGYQAMVLCFGGKLCIAPKLFHGKTSRIFHDGKGLFLGVPQAFSAMRYHSWIMDEGVALPNEVEMTSQTQEGVPMGIRHRSGRLEGVQFHPESYMTQHGRKLFQNFLEMH